jgi:hypothetical protein
MYKMKFRLFFAWYDLWVGMYWNKKKRTAYLCLIPMVCLKIAFGQNDSLWKCLLQAMQRPERNR